MRESAEPAGLHLIAVAVGLLAGWISLGLIGGLASCVAYAVLRWPRQSKRKDDAP